MKISKTNVISKISKTKRDINMMIKTSKISISSEISKISKTNEIINQINKYNEILR